MKKKITVLLLTALVMSFVACGNEAAPEPIDTPEPTVEATPEPTVEPTEAPTPEPTEEPTEEPEGGEAMTWYDYYLAGELDPEVPETSGGTEVEAPELPEDRAWVDDLYNKLVAIAVDAVVEILKDPGLIEKAEPYIYPDYKVWDYEEGYKLVTSDNKIVGIITMNDSIYAFYAPNGYKDGFSEILGGDICIYIEGGKVGYFDGETLHYEGQEDFYVGTDGVWMIWHY